MGYFTETMTLFEFKSDIEKANNRRLMHDLQSNQHNHSFNSMYSKDGKEFGKSTCKTSRDKRMRDRVNDDISGQDSSYYERRKKDREAAKSNPEYAKEKADWNKKINASKKSCKESFSEAFDSIIL